MISIIMSFDLFSVLASLHLASNFLPSYLEHFIIGFSIGAI